MKQLIERIRSVENIHATRDQGVPDILSGMLNKEELRDVEEAMAPVQLKRVLDCEMPCRLKLGKSLVYRNNLEAGVILSADDICAKVNEPFGISAERYYDFIGNTLLNSVVADENLVESHFQW